MFHNQGSMQGFGSGFNENTFQSSEGGFGSPAGGVDKVKKNRLQNITPVTALHIQQMTYNGSVFSLGDIEISQVTIVGTIIGVEKSQTCTTYKIDDTTGSVMVKHWNSFDSEDDPMEGEEKQIYEEGTPVRIFAQVRSFQKSVNLNALHIRPVDDVNEMTVHMLECVRFKLINEAKKSSESSSKMHMANSSGFMGQSNGSMNYNQSNAMNMGMDSTQAQVWRLIESCQEQVGMSVNDIRSTLKNLNINQIKKALDFLSNEGHIYSTIDEDHFRSTS